MRFAEEMLMLAGSDSRLDAAAAVEKAVSSGAAFDTMAKIVEHQGGNPAVLDDLSLLPSAPHEHVLTAETDGYIVRCDAYEIGLASVRLGAGRTTKKDQVDHSVGLMIEAKVGDTVEAGQPLATISYRDEDSLESALSVLVDTFVVSAEPVEPPDLILGELR
jgi:pyrimidine-nucleoside phosphorylase